MKEYFRLEVSKLQRLFKTKEFWKDLDNALDAYEALVTVWAKTQDAEHSDGILYKEMQTEFKTQYRDAITDVMESTKLH